MAQLEATEAEKAQDIMNSSEPVGDNDTSNILLLNSKGASNNPGSEDSSN